MSPDLGHPVSNRPNDYMTTATRRLSWYELLDLWYLPKLNLNFSWHRGIRTRDESQPCLAASSNTQLLSEGEEMDSKP